MSNPYPWHQSQWQFWQNQQGRYGHAYLLAGASGLGLNEFARQMAKSLLCLAPNTPCNVCQACGQFEQNQHADFFALEVLEGKKEIGIDQVRQLTQDLMQTAHQGGFKVAILQEVEHLNRSAFNALLKTLEEPPLGTVLILTSHQISQLPATIISRCLKIDFTTPTLDISQAWLNNQSESFEPALIKRSLQLNWGAPLDAYRWLQQQNWQQDQAWKEDMTALSQGKKSVNQVVAAWLKWSEPEQIFNQFYWLSVSRIRRAFYRSQDGWNPQWFQFQQQVLQAKLDWQQNANKELLLESLCLLSLQLLQQPDRLPNVFASQWIRGKWA